MAGPPLTREEQLLFGITPRGLSVTAPEAALMPTGEFLKLFEDQPAAPSEQFKLEPTAPVISSEFTSGLGAGVRQLGSDVIAASAVGSQLLGSEAGAAELMKLVQEREAETRRRFPRAIRKVEDIESLEDFTLWAARTLGEQVPVLASMFIGGGGGAIVGRLIARGAISRGAAASLAQRFPIIGSGVGLFGAATTLETGASATELFGATGEIHPEAALAAGVIKGALEMAVPAFIGSKFGLAPDITGGVLKRIIGRFEAILPSRIGTAVGVGVTEALTETLQEVTDVVVREFVDENFELLSPETASRLLNAAASGALVGAVLGGAVGSRGDVRSQQDQLPNTAPIVLGGEFPAPTIREQLLGTTSLTAEEATIGEGGIQASDSVPMMQPLGPKGSSGLELLDFPRTGLEEELGGLLLAPMEHERRPQTLEQEPTALFGSKMENALHQLGVRKAIEEGTADVYNVNTHEPGTAVWFKKKRQEITPQDDLRMQRVVGFYTKMMKRFGLVEDKLFVHYDNVFSDILPEYFDVTLTDANFVGSTGRAKKIGLRSLRTAQALHDSGADVQPLTEAEFFSTATHEFGHYLVHARFGETPSNLQQKILAAYHRAVIRVLMGDGRDIRQDFSAQASGRGRVFDELEGVRELEQGEIDYFLSFDEWMAEQIARHFEVRIVTLDPVDSWFKQVAQQLENLFNLAKSTFKLAAEPEVREWLTFLEKNPRPLSATGLAQSHAEGSAQNSEVLAPWNNGEFIPPPQNSSVGPATLLKKLGISKSKSDEIRAFSDKFNWFMDLMYNLQQIAQRNTHLVRLNTYVELVDQWYNFQMKWISRANDRVRSWIHLGNQQQKALAEFIFEIDAMEYLNNEEREAGIVRMPTNEELEARARKHGLNEVAFEIYLNIRDDFIAVLDQIEETSIRDIQRNISDPIIQQERLASLEREIQRQRERPYFPHARFGKIALIVKDESGTTLDMQHFPSKRAAEAASRDALKEHPGGEILIRAVPKDVRGFQGIPPTLLQKMRETLELSDEQQAWLDDLIISMSPTASFRRRLQKRENIPGFSMDAMRTYASYFFSVSKHLARIEFGPAMEEQVDLFQKETSDEAAAGTITDVVKRDRIRGYMANHMEHIMNPKPDWAQLRSVAFQWYLGFNVSSAALNFTQPVLVGWPYLAARFGDVKAMKAMMRAVKDIQGMYKLDKRAENMSLGLFKALNRWIQEGVIDESLSATLAGVAQGGHIQRVLPGTAAQRQVMQFARYSAWMFSLSEKSNRRVMARAAWELALKDPNSKYLNELVEQNKLEMIELWKSGFTDIEARAYLAGRDVVRRTMFQYAPHARPKFMRGKKGVLFAFFMFQQNMIHFTLHSPGHIRFLAMMLFMAGLMGLPGAEDLTEVAKFAARNLLGKEFDLEREVREFVTNLTDDPEYADLLLFGTGRVGFGLPALMDAVGLPKAEFDFSRRIGMGRVIPGLAELGPVGLSFDERMARITTDAAGAAYGVGINMLRAMQDDALPIDDFKRWERAMPTAVRNLSRAVRFLREGRERTRTGATLIDFDLTDTDHLAEIALVGLGFQPTRATRAWDRALMRKEVESYWAARRSILLRVFDYSIITGDARTRQGALRDIRQYNSTVPFGIMRITGKDIRKSRKQRMKARRMFEQGIPRAKAMRPLGREINRLFPQEEGGGEVTEEDMKVFR